ncbi:MAG: hypothetical protein KJ915_08890 [Candidatus Omnitrophica bacterium]|nr:hypothetical protein [Candidatus Omnitrophota bacterium]
MQSIYFFSAVLKIFKRKISIQDYFCYFFLNFIPLGLVIVLVWSVPLAIAQQQTNQDIYSEDNQAATDEYEPDIYALAAEDYASDELLYEPVVKGSFRFNFGVNPTDFIWKDASWLEHERSWRWVYGDKRYNTYDNSIYNQFQLSIDAPINDNLSMYTKISIDPWAFVGKSQTITLPSWYAATDGDDPVEIQLKYWSNKGRTYPETVRSAKGDSFDLPEIKVANGKSQPTEVKGKWDELNPWYHHIDIPSLKIDMELKPMKALWFDYKQDEYRAILFLYAEENISMYSDDPLKLVNNHIFWQASPWLYKWVPGRLYSVEGWAPGVWQADEVLRDSAGNWLTLLRAFRFESEIANIHTDFMLAAPLDLWDDYTDVNNIPLAFRFKKEFTDQFMLGGIYTSRIGFDKASQDAYDQAMAIDASYEINEWHTIKAETALSKTDQNINNPVYQVKNDDDAYTVALESKMDPFEMPVESKLSYSQMGKDFAPPLAVYNYTKNDQQWGRHIEFYRRGADEENYRIGDSLDKDRKVTAVDLHFGEFEGSDVYFNFRNVNSATEDQFVENVLRTEIANQASEQMLFKFLVIMHNRPDTLDGKSPDTYTGAAGFKYDFTEWLSLEEMVERTNEYPDFPDYLYTWLNANPDAPYPYYYINKTRVVITPDKWTEIGLEYVYNEFNYAATLDDFMNYAGADIRYQLYEDVSTRLVYRFSRVSDPGLDGDVVGHHNLYFECVYQCDKDSRFSLQFSDLGGYVSGLGWQSAVLDTQHIVRLVYEGIF